MVLGIETSTAVCGASLVSRGSLIAERSFEARQMHSEKLIGLIGDVLAAANIDISGLDAVAVSIGPGSFTGLRIGLSTAKGLAFGRDLPLVAVPTLKGLAFGTLSDAAAGPGDCILPMIDARRDEVYMALFRCGAAELIEALPDCACRVSELEKIIPAAQKVILVGDGVEKFVHFLHERGEPMSTTYEIQPREKRICRSSMIAMLGEQMLGNGDHADIASLEPLYVKEFYTTMSTHNTRRIADGLVS